MLPLSHAKDLSALRYTSMPLGETGFGALRDSEDGSAHHCLCAPGLADTVLLRSAVSRG